MPRLQPVGFLISLLLASLSVAMLIPAAVDLAYGNPDWHSFLVAAAVTLSVAGMCRMGQCLGVASTQAAAASGCFLFHGCFRIGHRLPGVGICPPDEPFSQVIDEYPSFGR